jgi:hypothetical protein
MSREAGATAMNETCEATRWQRTGTCLAGHGRRTAKVDASVIGLIMAVLAACSASSLDEQGGTVGGGQVVADAEAGAAASDEPAAVLGAVTAAMAASDLDLLVQLSTDAARVYFVHVRHFHAATGDDAHLFENLTLELDEPVVDGTTATADGLVAYGTADGAPPRVLTDWRLHETAEGWRVVGFTRNDEPVERWTVPGDGLSPVRHEDIEVDVLALFIDAGCFTGSDRGCPAAVRDSFAADLLVTNDTGGDLTPIPVELPGGEAVPAFITSSAGYHPVVQADAPGFPSGTTAEVTAVFTGASELSAGGTLHLAFETAAGEVVPFEIPLPAYPHDW